MSTADVGGGASISLILPSGISCPLWNPTQCWMAKNCPPNRYCNVGSTHKTHNFFRGHTQLLKQAKCPQRCSTNLSHLRACKCLKPSRVRAPLGGLSSQMASPALSHFILCCGGGVWAPELPSKMGEKSCTIRTRKFMSNKLLARKQFVSRPRGLVPLAGLRLSVTWVCAAVVLQSASRQHAFINGAANCLLLRGHRLLMCCTQAALTYQR